MSVNFNGPYLLMRLLMPVFREHKSGCVINIASKAGTLFGPFMASYCSSKAALINLTGCIQVEVDIEQLSGIHLYSIHPGGVRSVMVENSKFGMPLCSDDSHPRRGVLTLTALQSTPRTTSRSCRLLRRGSGTIQARTMTPHTSAA
jgi:NAD(P)-dependent dehydrogenase (short-subunit alcohol dehydrogenase family)